MRQHEKEWPIIFQASSIELPEEIKVSFTAFITEHEVPAIDISRFSKLKKLIRVTSRVLNIFNRNSKPSLSNMSNELSVEN